MTFTIIKETCTNEDALLSLAAKLALAVSGGSVIFLQGPLGAGKTTFSRGFLAALGYKGKVKSPTYTLLEQYNLPGRVINHFDLYRIVDENELEQIGIRDYFQPNAISLIEWPEKASEMLPQPDIKCEIAFVDEGRVVTLAACSERGEKDINHLS